MAPRRRISRAPATPTRRCRKPSRKRPSRWRSERSISEAPPATRGGALSGAGRFGAGLVALLTVTSILSMLGSSSFSALLPEFQALWHLSNTEAGWISGIFFAGYVLGVPVLVGITDRVDARPVYLLSLVMAALASLGYAFLADAFASAFIFRALAGLELAGTYMPGLKLMTARLGAPLRPGRYVAYYTAGFSLGTALSFPFTAEIAQWRACRAALSAAAPHPPSPPL